MARDESDSDHDNDSSSDDNEEDEDLEPVITAGRRRRNRVESDDEDEGGGGAKRRCQEGAAERAGSPWRGGQARVGDVRWAVAQANALRWLPHRRSLGLVDVFPPRATETRVAHMQLVSTK